MSDSLTNPQSQLLISAAILKRLENIETKLDKKVAFLSVDEAVTAYKRHLSEGTNRKGRRFTLDSRENFSWFLTKLEAHFEGKNIAEITADECAGFLEAYWKESSSGTYRQRIVQLRIFLNFCIQYLKRKGNPVFHNPCDLLDPVAHQVKQPVWMPVEMMRLFLQSATERHHWLAFAIMLTSGVRINDLMNLRKQDVEGRILRLRMHDTYRPKSGKLEEIAVIPETVSVRLQSQLAGKHKDSLIIPVKEITIFKAVKSHGKRFKMDINNHYLRKWAASYWERKNEFGMVHFVLRHSSINLKDRYIAPLNIQEVMDKQEILEKELLG
jgi:integrase